MFKVFIKFSNFVTKSLFFTNNCYSLGGLSSGQSIFPSLVNLFEFLGFVRQLFRNIGRIKNWLQIHPLSLQFRPLFQNIRNVLQSLVPLYYSFFKRLLKRRKKHCLSWNYILVQNLTYIVPTLYYISSFILKKTETNVLPTRKHVI